MRIGRVLYLIGKISLILGASMLLPLITSLIYPDGDFAAFALSIPICLLAGLLLMWLCRGQKHQVMRQRECYLFVTAVWLYAGVVGALPYLFSGAIPSFAAAFFETISGFTTTGSTVIVNVDATPHGLLLWRSLTHWLGGAGIVLLFVALIERKGSSGEGITIYKAEYSGGALSERLAVRIEDNAQIIFWVYAGLTISCMLLLLLGGMSFFDAVNHAMATTSTGGFSTKTASMAAFSPFCQWVVGIFLVLSGINFSLYFLLLVRRRVRQVLRDEETLAYLGIVLASTLLIAYSLWQHQYYGNAEEIFRQSFFQVATIISTGGFATADFDLWPSLARGILFLLLLCGGCSGSTASGVKVSRIVILCKSMARELRSTFRPQQIHRIEYNDKRLEDEVPQRMMYFLFSYLVLVISGSLILMLDDVQWMEAIVACISSIGNVGPALGSMGPAGNFAACSGLTHIVLSFLMLAGRLEIFTMLVLFFPAVWKK
ncbi:MAG: TrkH family potassium uptake protein [Firmicutes bacterium]|nr:TrkH family potassium uptake protein [Bacillota bacterium]